MGDLKGRLFLQQSGHKNIFAGLPFLFGSRFHPGTCVYSNLETKTLLQQSRDPNGIQIAVRAGSHPGTCVYSNLETKTLLQQSRDPNGIQITVRAGSTRVCYWFHPSTCVYNNVDPMDLYCCNCNMELVHS